MWPTCVVKVVNVLLRNQLLNSIFVDGEPVFSGKLPGHSCFCVSKHFCFEILANLTIDIGVVRRRPTSNQLIQILGCSLGLLVDGHNPSSGIVAGEGVWDLDLAKQTEHLSVCALGFIPLMHIWKYLCASPKC